MRRKKDDKRVLRSGKGKNNNTRRPPHMRNRQNKKSATTKTSGKTVGLMIFVLVAFIIGAGIGVVLSFEHDAPEVKNETHVENVTVEMTTNLTNKTDQVTFDEADAVDFNENKSSELLGAEDNPYYKYDKEDHYG